MADVGQANRRTEPNQVRKLCRKLKQFLYDQGNNDMQERCHKAYAGESRKLSDHPPYGPLIKIAAIDSPMGILTRPIKCLSLVKILYSSLFSHAAGRLSSAD